MTVIAVIGDCTTTTCVALAAGWAVDDVLVLEADPSGGSLAGWLDTPSSPSLATIVANAGVRESSDGTVMSTVSAMTQRSASGVRFVAAPLRTLAARRAIEEATAFVVPALAASDVVTLADLGRRDPANLPTDIVAAAAATLVVHRQHAASAAAEAVRLERLVELIEHLAAHARTVVIAVVGSDPFDPAEIAQHVEASVPGAVAEVRHARRRSTRGGRARWTRRRVGQSPPTPPTHALRGECRVPTGARVANGPRLPRCAVVSLHGPTPGGVVDESRATVSLLTDRVASRLIEAIEHDDAQHSERRTPGLSLAADERRQQLLVGAWIGDEIATVNEERLQRGERPLSISREQHVRARVVAELTGAGPLEPFISDPDVEEIDVNGPDSTWVTYTDGRKVDVGALWTSAAELTALPEADGAAHDRHRRGAARHVVADAHPAVA